MSTPYTAGAAQAGQTVYPGQQHPGYGPPQQGYPPQGYAPPPQQGYAATQQGWGPPPGQQQYPGGPPNQGYPAPQQQGYMYGGQPPPQHMPPTASQQPGYVGTQQTDGMQAKPGFGPPPQGDVQTPSYTGSDVPDQDVDDNENAKAPAPTAPPADMFSTYAGYENTGFG